MISHVCLSTNIHHYRYLKPLDMTDDQKKNMHKGLIELRNNACLGMAMINLLWIAINFMFQLNSPTKIRISLAAVSFYLSLLFTYAVAC